MVSYHFLVVAQQSYFQNINFLNVESCVEILANSIFVNSTLCANLNNTASVSLHNLSFTYLPVALKDGVYCNSCVRQSYVNKSFISVAARAGRSPKAV